MKTELNKATRWIADDRLREWIDGKLQDAPEYFWTMPASTTGKYHPSYSLGEGGLVRHTRAAVYMALELSESYGLSTRELDLAIAALVLHDSWKKGKSAKSKHTVFEHPDIAAEWIREDAEPGSTRAQVAELVLTHMGANGWGKNPPVSALQWFVHTCDYLASRKNIHVDLDASKC